MSNDENQKEIKDSAEPVPEENIFENSGFEEIFKGGEPKNGENKLKL